MTPKQSVQQRVPNYDLAFFIGRMILIRENDRQRFVKNRDSLVKCHFVFLKIPSCLIGVPFKDQLHTGPFHHMRSDCDEGI